MHTPARQRAGHFLFMIKVNFYIDGFNLYHAAFKKHQVTLPDNTTIKAGWPELRWQNLRELMLQFINPQKEEIGDIYYFSATADWLPSKAEKHKSYINALSSEGVRVILGKFKAKEKRCQADCKKMFISHEEKESDVNVAIHLLSDILQNKCDTAYLVSGDSDMGPAIRQAKRLCPQKRIGLILPPYQKGADLKSSVDFYKKITRKHLKKSLFPRAINFSDSIIYAPSGWLPPEKI